MLKLLRVQGESMTPEYQNGDFVLIWRLTKPKVGDVVVFRNPFYGILIKQIQKIGVEGIYVIGTGENSLDSRRLGPVDPVTILGKVIWHIRR